MSSGDTGTLWAHPRAGGENTAYMRDGHPEMGSSPRGRGKLEGVQHEVLGQGLIPARAGKTRRPCGRSRGNRAHPRAGGENCAGLGAQGPAWGSSPRERGKPADRAGRLAVGGLIPARAGKTLLRASFTWFDRAHPRAGGENLAVPPRRATSRGSSPRGRGKRPGRSGVLRHAGLIPARAGKTARSGTRPHRTAAHPRAGGENAYVRKLNAHGAGSSPRGRGKLTSLDLREVSLGLIPARAGKTITRRNRPRPSRAHPRAGGENSLRLESAAWSPGSSPRGRGKREGGHPGLARGGLIPARAGKTEACHSSRLPRWAHPRAGGENSCPSWPRATTLGSSPRGRGKLRARERGVNRSGLIPARAGKTSSGGA